MNIAERPGTGWTPDIAAARTPHRGDEPTWPVLTGDIGVINLRGAMSTVATLDPAVLTDRPGGAAPAAWTEMLQALPGRLQLTVRRPRQERPGGWQAFLTCHEPNRLGPGGREFAATAVRDRIERVARLLTRAAVPTRILDGAELSALVGAPTEPAGPFWPAETRNATAGRRPDGFAIGGLVEVGEVCSATVAIIVGTSARGLPPGWLEGLLAFPGRLDLALHLTQTTPGWLHLGTYATVYAPTPDLLTEAQDELVRHVDAIGLSVHPHRIRPVPGWVSTLPLGLDLLDAHQTLGVDALTTSLAPTPVTAGGRRDQKQTGRPRF